MRRLWAIAIALFLLGACAETERCPEGQVFGDAGTCVDITPPSDAGTD